MTEWPNSLPAIGVTTGHPLFWNLTLSPDIYGQRYVVGSRFYCLCVCKVMMSACPEILLGCLSGSVGLGVMPLALALASVPLVHEVVDGRRPSSAALTPAAVALLVAGVVHFTISYAESTRAGIELSPATSPFPQKLVDRAR